MSDWKLPPIPRSSVSADAALADELARPKDYSRANKWISQAIELREKGAHARALSLLQKAADLCPYEIGHWLLIGDIYQELGNTEAARHSYEIARAYGDLAAGDKLRRLSAQEVEPIIDDLIEKRTPESLAQVKKLLCEPKSAVLHWSGYRDTAKKIGKLKVVNAGDVAWALFNRALVEAGTAQSYLYTIYTAMGKQLAREGKHRGAMEQYLRAFLDAKEYPPAYIRQNLETCFGKMDKADETNLDKCLGLARSRGIEAAMQYLDAGERKGILGRLFR